MKTTTRIVLIVIGLIFYATGIAFGGEGMAMMVSLLGGVIMVVGLLPILDKETFVKVEKRK